LSGEIHGLRGAGSMSTRAVSIAAR
jgi:hypothetical protein